MRKRVFNKGWVYHDTVTSSMAAGFGGGGDHAAEIELPHDAMIHTRRSPKAAGGAAEGYFESTDCEYTKQFRLEEKDQVCYLEFDGVYRNAAILVNGEYVGWLLNAFCVLWNDQQLL